MRSLTISLVSILLWVSTAEAAKPRAYYQAQVRQNHGSVTQTSGSYTEAVNAIHEVNAARARRGLRPFVHDPELHNAAWVCANYRASVLLAGHTSNDFAALRHGVSASAAGCGGLEPSWGWGSCCTYDNYTYAGAAVAIGRDGKRYMHIFVR